MPLAGLLRHFRAGERGREGGSAEQVHLHEAKRRLMKRPRKRDSLVANALERVLMCRTSTGAGRVLCCLLFSSLCSPSGKKREKREKNKGPSFLLLRQPFPVSRTGFIGERDVFLARASPPSPLFILHFAVLNRPTSLSLSLLNYYHNSTS